MNNNGNNTSNQFGGFGANASSTSNFGAPSPFASNTSSSTINNGTGMNSNPGMGNGNNNNNNGGAASSFGAFGTSNNLALALDTTRTNTNTNTNNNTNNAFGGSSFGNPAAGSNNPNSAASGFGFQQRMPATTSTSTNTNNVTAVASPFGTSTTLASTFGQGFVRNASTLVATPTTTSTTFGTSSNMAATSRVPGFGSSIAPGTATATATATASGFGTSSMSSPFGTSNTNNNATATSSSNPFGTGAPAASFASPFGNGNQRDNYNANEESEQAQANKEWVNPNSKRHGPNTNNNANNNANNSANAETAEGKLSKLKAMIELKKKKFLEMQEAKANGETGVNSNVNVNANTGFNATGTCSTTVNRNANINRNANTGFGFNASLALNATGNTNANANTGFGFGFNASSALNANATSFAPVRPVSFGFGQSNNNNDDASGGGDGGEGKYADTGMDDNVNVNQALRNRIPKKKNHGKKPSKQLQQQQPPPPSSSNADDDDESDRKAQLAAKNARRFATAPTAPPPISTSNVDDDDENDRNTQLAARNAQRFAQVQKRDTLSMLPKELQQLARDYHPSQSSNSNNRDGDNDNDNDENGNLIGMCMHMCPDEELVRRESEGDVQMLELPLVGIHPQGWTLRDTCVKRFRRSAADFKLDIPELIRPPLVLERVCSYLEEWIMERDRQGVDPRFGGLIPPPLDVYQFIWDRTRMVRKDFILQNFIGTGGNCSAVAVRCHERIARWHALCEHQLSHLNDFIRQQSQQNIQELGATMKSLNLYYDDAAGRATMEDGDAPASSSDQVHGCQSSIVMGKSPKDYNGESLMNASETVNPSNRIIGNATGGSGTAEPEMRGLYILLTINNDGGMEVLKYAARLSRDRPEIFNSKPVQLAMQVYKVSSFAFM